MTPYKTDPGPEGSNPQGPRQQGTKQFIFKERRVRVAGLVPAPVAWLAAGCAAAIIAASLSLAWHHGVAAVACFIVLAIIIQARARPVMYHDASRDVLLVRKGVSWRALAGFRVVHLPTNVDGNQHRLVRHLHGIDPKVTFRIVVSRHEFPRESRSRAGSWFVPKGDDVTTLAPGESGHAWLLVLDRPVSLLGGVSRGIAALARARDATKAMFPNTYPHHQFRAATAGELALVGS